MKAIVVSKWQWVKGVIYVDSNSAEEIVRITDKAKEYGTFMSCIRIGEDEWEITIELKQDNMEAFYKEFNNKQ